MLTKQLMLVGMLFLVTMVAYGSSRDMFSVCARMDIWGLSEVAEKLCIGACCSQNCGTGRCYKRHGRPVCICSRCANGGGAGIGCFIGK